MISPSFFSSGGESKFYKQSITSQLLPTPSSKNGFLVYCECLHRFNLVFRPILLMQTKIAHRKLILWLVVDISILRTRNVPKDGNFTGFFFCPLL